MMKNKDYAVLVRTTDAIEAKWLAGYLERGHVTYHTRPISRTGPSRSWGYQGQTVEVLKDDLAKAERLLAEYRKTKGVPFN
jgi:hypothetical protein